MQPLGRFAKSLGRIDNSPYKRIVQNAAVQQVLVIFISVRLFLSVWAVVALMASPLPEERDEALRPYLGEPRLREGGAGLLLGPWQRFDTQHYLRIARNGYAAEADSVFPPLYPLAIRAVGGLMGGSPTANLAAAIVLSNLACLGLLILLHRVVTAELGPEYATRTLIYFVLFPTGFFLFAAYSESIFLLLALGSLWAARNGRFWLAGVLGFLAALTRLTGWILVVPLVYELWRQRGRGAEEQGSGGAGEHHPSNRRACPEAAEGLPTPSTSSEQAPSPAHPFTRSPLHLVTLSPLLPALGTAAFIAWRWWADMAPLSVVYGRYWFQRTGFPGVDMVTAASTLFFGGLARANEIVALSFDFFCALLLIATTALAWRRLPRIYGLYSAMLLLFILLPTSELKPLYSFSRYALAFFPTFMLLALAGERPWVNRLILYPSLALYLYFSGQFFIWGWVA